VTVYKVTGRQRYLGYPIGETFVAQLEPDAEARAVARGAIQVIDSTAPTVEAERLTMPRGKEGTDGSQGRR
jgi:hypothetical protein